MEKEPKWGPRGPRDGAPNGTRGAWEGEKRKEERKTESNNGGTKGLRGPQKVALKKVLRGPVKDPEWDPGGPRKGFKGAGEGT
jgi:hypothetical protein